MKYFPPTDEELRAEERRLARERRAGEERRKKQELFNFSEEKICDRRSMYERRKGPRRKTEHNDAEDW